MKTTKIAELKNKLSIMQDDLHSMVFSEMPQIMIVKQQAKIKATKNQKKNLLMENMNIEKIKNLKQGQIFRTENGRYRIERPYWPSARNPRYRAANIVCLERLASHPYYGMQVSNAAVSFNCNTKVVIE